MGDMALPVALQAVNIGSNHYHKVTDPIQYKIQKARGQIPRDDPDIRDAINHEDKGYVLRKRSEVQPGEEIVETVRHRGQVLPRRPGRPAMTRQTSSMDDMRSNGDYSRRRYRGGDRDRDRDYGYDSEGSVPPRGRVRPRSESGRRRRNTSSSSSSDIGSSTDEEKQIRKMKRKKWITAALASVATIHAASKVYSSIEEHDKRIIQVEKGKISPEEAHKKQRAARWQDAAAIGIAALGIKGALSEWHEVQEEHGEHMEMMKKKEEHHKKRLEKARRERAKEQGGYYKGHDGNWYYDGPAPQNSEKQRSRSVNQRAIDGPRQNDVKMIEDTPARDRDRSIYGDRDRGYGRDRSRARSEYAYDDRDSVRDDRYRDRSRRRDTRIAAATAAAGSNYEVKSRDRSRRRSERTKPRDSNNSPPSGGDDDDDKKKKHKPLLPEKPYEAPTGTKRDLAVDVADEVLEAMR